MKTKFLYILLVVSFVNYAYASGDSLKHHVVVMLDGSGSVDRFNNSETILNLLSRTLPNSLLNEGGIDHASLSPTRPLLKDGDYLSVLTFGFSRNNPDAINYIKTSLGDGKSYGPKYSTDIGKDVFTKLGKTVTTSSFFNKNWTGLSFAGPLGLIELNTGDKPTDINRTFVVVVTDGQFNNISDPNNEVETLKGVGVKNTDLILERYGKIKDAYNWRSIYKGGNQGRNQYKFEIFEYTPNVGKGFSVISYSTFPDKVELERRSNGNYVYELELNKAKGAIFQVRKTNVLVEDKINNTIIYDKTFNRLASDTTLTINVDKQYINDSLQLRAKFWVYYKDGVYGAHTLHPDGSIKQGKAGLTPTAAVTFEPKAKVFGLLPLGSMPLKLFSVFQSQYAVARIIEAITMGIIVMLLYFWIFSRQKYKSLNKNDWAKVSM